MKKLWNRKGLTVKPTDKLGVSSGALVARTEGVRQSKKGNNLEAHSVDRTITDHVRENQKVVDKGPVREEISSLWDVAYMNHALIKAHLVQKKRQEWLHKQSLFTLWKEQEAMATRLAMVLATSEEKIRKVLVGRKKMMNELEKAEIEKGKLEKKVMRLTKAMNTLDSDNKIARDRVQELEKGVTDFMTSKDRIGKKLEQSQAKEKLKADEATSLTAKVGAQKLEIIAKFVAGFTTAETQVKALFSDIDLSQMGCFKKVVDDKMLEVQEDGVVDENHI
ncbi:hypothetical protein VNO78_16067 [Psophocarpus tetragonolobus]|uniref:Uncharacterized protein n=1 Tax=Psophocarpus tetragonolobus TaxID=3891 RepID=A0AAN9SF52_PSOTE